MQTPEEPLAPRHSRGWWWPLIGFGAVAALVIWLLSYCSGVGTVTEPHAASAAELESGPGEIAEEPEPEPAPTTTTTATTPASPTVLDVLTSDGQFAGMITLTESSGLGSILQGDDPVTVFAPSDAAMSSLSPAFVERLNDDPEALEAVLLNHMVGEEISSADLAGRSSVTTLAGTELVVTAGSAGVRVADATVTRADLKASNGVIHEIDTLIMPAGLFEDEAADLLATMEARGGYSTLLALLAQTGLAETLLPEGPFTVFAPDDEAFDSLSGAEPTPDELRTLLLDHIVVGRVTSADLMELEQVSTFSGRTLTVTTADGLSVANAQIVEADIEARNGIIHRVDSVIVPAPAAGETLNEILALDPVTFETDSAIITAEGLAVLDEAVAFLEANPISVEVGGHTDDVGDASYNQGLSLRRAAAVVEYLVEQGIDAGLLTAVGYGESEPVADNDSSEGRAQNRRIEFTIIG